VSGELTENTLVLADTAESGTTAECVDKLSLEQPWFPDVLYAAHEAFRTSPYSRINIAVAGESGSGKSTLAYSLADDLARRFGLVSLVMGIDGYFHLPPKANHVARKEDLSRVGPQEVDLERLDQTLQKSHDGNNRVVVPRKSYHSDNSYDQLISLEGVDCILVEGTYALMLNNVDLRIFIDRPFFVTQSDRQKRGRDTWALEDLEWNEKLLRIEHNIITSTKDYADLIIEQDGAISRKQQFLTA
jgi:uridine kinase